MNPIIPRHSDSLNYQGLSLNNPDSTSASLDLTVLRADQKKAVRKTVALASDGRIVTQKLYPGVKLWTRSTLAVPHDIDALGAAISCLSGQHDCCLVTGGITGPIPTDKPARRLKHSDGDYPATLDETTAAWLPVDCDKVLLSDPLDPIDPEPAIAEVVERLGYPMNVTSYAWQLTASASPGADRLSVRLFFLVDRRISNADRKAWANELIRQTGEKLVDTALFNAAQPIYTATPEFRGHDPFPRRCGVVYGEFEELPWQSVQVESARREYQGGAWTGNVHRSIEKLLAVIGDGPGQEGFHHPINAAIWQMVYHQWTRDRIKQVIRDTAFSTDASKHSESELRDRTNDVYLNRSIKGAEKKIKASMQTARATRTVVADKPVSMAEAAKIIGGHYLAWLKGEGPAKLGIKVPPGVGKTHQLVEAILNHLPADATLLWAHPTHQQGQEVQEQFNGRYTNRQAVRIEGRVREGADVDPLCKRPQVIRGIKAAGASRNTKIIACQNGASVCPHWRGCDYYRQFLGSERVRLVPHALLPITQSRAFTDSFMDACAGLVIDESPLGVLTGHKGYKVAEVIGAEGVLAEVIKAIRDKMAIDPASVIPQLEVEMAERCIGDPWEMLPGDDSDWLIHELKKLEAKKKPKFLALYKATIAYLQGKTNLVWFKEDDETVFCAWKHELPEVKRVLVLDATGDEEVYKALFGDDFHLVTVHVEQNADIIQAHDVPMGKGRIAPKQPKEGDEPLSFNDGTLAQIVALARMLGAGLITNKAAVEAAKERGWIPDGMATGHFNALRGVNAMKELTTLIIAGRPEPDAKAIEATARALWPCEALNLTGEYVRAVDGVSSVASHPDHRCDSLLRMFREAEITQAIGRLRAVRSSTRKTVIILTHVPTGLPVQSLTYAEIVPPVQLARLLLAGGGVAPMVPELMTRLCPDEWKTVDAAAKWRTDLKRSFPLYRYLPKQKLLFKFRCQGQKQWSWAISELDVFHTWERLEAISVSAVVECAHTSEEEPPHEKNQEPDHATDPGAWDSARLTDKPTGPVRQKPPQKPATAPKRAPTRQDSLKVFERAWWASGTPIKNDYPYISASALGQLLATDRRSDRTSEIILPLLDVGLIESLESGYIVKDNVQASAWMLAMT